jgi:hypothetical protein
MFIEKVPVILSESAIVILSEAKDPCSLNREAKDPSLRSG